MSEPIGEDCPACGLNSGHWPGFGTSNKEVECFTCKALLTTDSDFITGDGEELFYFWFVKMTDETVTKPPRA